MSKQVMRGWYWVSVVLMALAGPAFGARVAISQSKSVAGDVTPGDEPDFPHHGSG